MKQSELSLTFRVEKNVFNNGTPDDPRRVIIGECKFTDGDREGTDVVVKGEALEGKLLRGMPYRFYGHWHEHHTYGRQFLFANFIAETPASEEGIVAYLSQLTGDRIGTTRGIGKGMAFQMWELYGADAIDRLKKRPHFVATEVRGLSEETADKAAAWLIINEAIERCKIDLMGLLNGRGFPKKTVDHAIQKWGAKAHEFVRANPFLLMSFRGCGFRSTDKMYLDLGFKPYKLKRQALCGWYAVACKTKQDGDTWHRVQFVEQSIRKNVAAAGKTIDINRAIELAVRGGLLSRRVESDRSVWVAETRKAENEFRLAEYVKGALAEESNWPGIPFVSEDGDPGVTEHQAIQLGNAKQSAIGCLAGSPGTGKTYAAAALIKAIIGTHGSHCIAVAAPTGKAAVRLTEELTDAEIPIAARTIHRLLGVLHADDGDGWRFEYNEANPLPHRFIIVDESSMIDTDLMASLFAARSPGTHILPTGDHRQLAPVGHGCPFYDFQQAGVPTGEFVEVQRNSGRIVKACAEIRDHSRFEASPGPHDRRSIEAGENLIVSNIGDNPELQIDSLLKSIPWAARELNLNPIWGIQVVVAVNKKSPLSREALNKRLQAELNPTGETAKGNPFRVSDKIINLKNGWFPAEGHCPEADEDGNIFVANGEQAEVVAVTPARTIARLQSPERLVVIPHGPQRKSDSDGDDEKSSTGVGSWDLGYAITVHKSQGSEWPCIIGMIDEYAGAKMLCTRNWIYTLISRGKKLCLLIGKKSTADQMVRKNGLRRKTFLVERIKGDCGGQVATVCDVADVTATCPPVSTTESSEPIEERELVLVTASDEEWKGLFS